ncbi:TLC domain-containing protein [Mrakia frigida]|uniref:TLC domain-containing protein n=1 Tax=Mrakia frigida TaxID=29902 RepID=UPI003FCBFE81
MLSSSLLYPFLHLSYPTTTSSSTTTYLKGPRDLAFIFSSFLAFTLLREILMRFVFAPIARRYVPNAGGGSEVELKKEKGGGGGKRKVGETELRVRSKASTRFAEQGWSLLYYVVYWSFGMSLFLASTSYRPGHWIPFDFPAIWQAYPELALSGAQKFYYLTQLAFWFHQLLTLHLEARRKDHWQMFSHHLITIYLVSGSYLTNITAIGTVVLVTMDFGDIIFSAAKMMKYLEFPQLVTDIMFGLFLCSWFFTRQIGLLLITLNVWDESPKHISLYEPGAYPLGPWDIHYSPLAHKTFYISLGLLWVLMCVWFAMICKVLVKVVFGTGAEDTRSDDEGGEEEDFEEKEKVMGAKVVEKNEKGKGGEKKKGGGEEEGKRVLRKRK